MSSGEDNDVINEREHDALLRDIRFLGKALKPKSAEIERPTLKKKSFDKSNILDDLVNAISSTRNIAELKTHLNGPDQRRKRKAKTLLKPLHRQARERVEAEFAYKESKKELRSWDPIVQGNRAAERLFFPLNDPETFYGTSTIEKAKSFTPRTPFEKELFEKIKLKPAEDDEQLTEAAKEVVSAMDLKEARKRKIRLQRMRAMISHESAKNARESKIKSKKFHRIRKKEKRRQIIKEIEDLVQNNPEAAREKLKELEKDRVYERATLKHRSTGKWSVMLRQYSSKNPGMQKLISEHLQLGRELKSKQYGLEKAIEGESDSDKDDEDKPLTKGEMLELAAEQAKRELESEESFQIKKASEDPALIKKLEEIRQRNTKSIVSVKLPEEDLGAGNSDNEENNEGFLAQAFNADDVVGEFVEEKKRLEEESGPKIIDKRLFGWGSWTGPGISEEKQSQKLQRFVTATKGKKRKDQGKKGLIIREELADQSLAKLQPKDVPFPFSAVKDFEAVIRQPIGKDWNTTVAHKSLIKKAINTKAGRIIRPMKKDDVMRRTTEALFDKDDDEI